MPLPPGAYTHPRFSPDGKQLVVGTDDGKDQIVWLYNMSGGTTLRRLTFGGKNQYPMWSHNGRHVIFTSDREGDNGLFWQLADGTGAAERLIKADQSVVQQAQAIDPSGKTLAFFAFRGAAGGISMLSMDGDRMPKVFAEAPNTIQPHAAFSPDGRWVAYASTESAASSNIRSALSKYWGEISNHDRHRWRRLPRVVPQQQTNFVFVYRLTP